MTTTTGSGILTEIIRDTTLMDTFHLLARAVKMAMRPLPCVCRATLITAIAKCRLTLRVKTQLQGLVRMCTVGGGLLLEGLRSASVCPLPEMRGHFKFTAANND